MLVENLRPVHGLSLLREDNESLSLANAVAVELLLTQRGAYAPTPVSSLKSLAKYLRVGSIHVKDEGFRLGLGSFKALGGSYAVIRLALEFASERLRRPVAFADLRNLDVRSTLGALTFACATDGNHGRSVAQGAQLVGAKSTIFVHSGVSDERVAAISRLGATIIKIDGNYDDSVREATAVSALNEWIVVSDTSWPGYERIPILVMQGYTAIVSEALRQMPEPPTHFVIQAGVGGVAAALAGHFAVALGNARPTTIIVEPSNAACVLEACRHGGPIKMAETKPTVMAMLECYEASMVAWRILARVGDFFMTVEDREAVAAMNLLAKPRGNDAAIVAGESGCVGMAGLLNLCGDDALRKATNINEKSRIFIVNTEGATDPIRYKALTGYAPNVVSRRAET